MTIYAVGDLQGCIEPLWRLLDRVEFNVDCDRLWLVGDLINRGPDNLKTLNWVYERRDNIIAVLGNHDLHLLAAATGARKPGKSDNFHDILEAQNSDTLLDWLRHRPLAHQEHGHVMTHAGIPPIWSVTQTMALAAEVESVLRSSNPKRFFDRMYGNEPIRWSPTLKGMVRLRAITNYLTRMRYCTENGALDLTSKGPEPDFETLEGQPLLPWFAHINADLEDHRVIFGHWASLNGATNNANFVGLDTGCVWDGAMTLYRLDDAKRFSCPCSAGRPAA